MSALEEAESVVSIEEFLAAEETSLSRHEYIGGSIYAMSGASVPHGVIAGNLAGLMFIRLRGSGSRYFPSATGLKFAVQQVNYFCYPDGVILCGSSFTGKYFEQATAIFEITSESTRSIDEREKRISYHQLSGLKSYVRIEQERPEVIVDSLDADGWRSRQYLGLDAVAVLGFHDLSLSLADLYLDVVFPQ